MIDENNLELQSYTNIYYSREGRRDKMDGPLYFEGPHRFDSDGITKLRRVGDDWQIATRIGGRLVFQRPNESVALDDWAKKTGAKNLER